MDENGTKKNLAAKVAEVIKRSKAIVKDGRNDFHKYDYIKEATILEEMRGIMAEVGIVALPNCVEHTRIGDLTTIMMAYTFIDIESGESIVLHFPGQGADKQDKGAYKAMTGANKYAIWKTFMIPTLDDPEKTKGSSNKRTKANFKARPDKATDEQLVGYVRDLYAKLDQQRYDDLAQETVELMTGKPERKAIEAIYKRLEEAIDD